MTLASTTSRDSIRIERAAITHNESGGEQRSYSTTHRGALPVSIRCRIQPLKVEQRIALGMHGERAVWKLLFSTDPALALSDRVLFTDAEERQRIANVVEPSLNLDGQSRLFRAIAAELENDQ